MRRALSTRLCSACVLPSVLCFSFLFRCPTVGRGRSELIGRLPRKQRGAAAFTKVRKLRADCLMCCVCCVCVSVCLSACRKCDHEKELHRVALEDHVLHRLSQPMKASEIDWGKARRTFVGAKQTWYMFLQYVSPSQVLMVPRFGVEQGTRKDGSVKVRPCACTASLTLKSRLHCPLNAVTKCVRLGVAFSDC